jgi:hypothetical protein
MFPLTYIYLLISYSLNIKDASETNYIQLKGIDTDSICFTIKIIDTDSSPIKGANLYIYDTIGSKWSFRSNNKGIISNIKLDCKFKYAFESMHSLFYSKRVEIIYPCITIKDTIFFKLKSNISIH